MVDGDATSNGQTLDMERLLFRRQFVIGERQFTPNRHWRTLELKHGLILSCHSDLKFTTVSKKETSLTLIGIAVNPHNPNWDERMILEDTIERCDSLDSCIETTKPLAGRWVIVFENQEDTCLFTDPCGLRQIYYYHSESEFWCGSQPEVLRENVSLSHDQSSELNEFLLHPNHSKRESAWFGDSTIYKDCRHLLPNHYYSVKHAQAIRFYPCGSMVAEKEIGQIIPKASGLLSGTMLSLAGRYKLRQALTAGMDSRVILAASRQVSDQYRLFCVSQTTF